MKTALCPVCWHRETMAALRNDQEPCRDDAEKMRYRPPHGGPRGQEVTRTDNGLWICEICGLALIPEDAAILIDAVLRVSDPNSDSFNGETFEDAIIAHNGGQHD